MARTLKSVTAFVEEIDHLVRSGRLQNARQLLQRFRRKRLERPERLTLARAARRAGLPLLSLRWLNPIVRPSQKNPVRSTENEKAEYAASLVRVGASTEALNLLSKLDPVRTPEALLYRGYALITRWEYSDVIPLLSEFIKVAGIDPFQHLVGKVNLAAALVHEEFSGRATEILAELREETTKEQLHTLHGNTLELSAQHALNQGDWNKGTEFLEQAERALKLTGGLDSFFVRKWKIILEVLKNPSSEDARKKMAMLRQEALALEHWETVRDCDYYRTLAFQDAGLATHLHFGTPYVSFRRRIARVMTTNFHPPDEYVWSLTEKQGKVWDLLTGGALTNGERLKVGQLLHRLLAVLVSDFYRPQRLASIYAHLYPNEYFNPDTSPTRVHQAMKNLRRWFSDNQVPTFVIERDGTYRLQALSPCSLKIPNDQWRSGSPSASLLVLKTEFKTNYFSAAFASQKLSTARRTAFRLLQKGVEEGLLERTGSGTQTVYRFR